MMAETPVLPIITMPQGKKSKVKAANTAMVLNSLTSTLPIVMPDVAPHLMANSAARSAPNSPERERRKSKGFLKKHLGSRPKSPSRQPNRTFHSDPEESSPGPSPQARPRWLPFKNKKKKSTDMNNGEHKVPAQDIDIDLTTSSGSSYEPEATPVEELPGRTYSNCGSIVPEIRVSSEGHDQSGGSGAGGAVTFEDISGTLDPYRKNSQSSRCSSGSGLMSVGTSGIGSCLSPSGDESSDIESPLSPCSRTSSFTEDATGDMSDTDPIERDLSPVRQSPLSGSNDNLSVTTPTPTSESPPNTLDRASLASPTSPDDRDLKLTKKKRDKLANKVSWEGFWMYIRVCAPYYSSYWLNRRMGNE